MMQPFMGDAEIAAFAEAAQASCATAAGDPDAIAAALAGDGLLGVIASEQAGGLGLPLKFAQPVLWAAGTARLAFPLVETLAALPLLEAAAPALARAVVAGQGIVSATGEAVLDVSGGRMSGRARAVPLGAAARWIVAPTAAGLAVAAVDGAGMSPAEEIDPDLPRTTLSFRDHPVIALIEDADAIAEWEARDLAFRSIDAAAAAAASIALAIGFLSDRRQFGKPLVTFQALRHDLARAKMQLESLNRLNETALLAQGPQERLAAAELAYAQATAVTPGIVELALHQHGGMGFTWDVPVHLYLRRLRDGFGGRAQSWARARVAARVIAA